MASRHITVYKIADTTILLWTVHATAHQHHTHLDGVRTTVRLSQKVSSGICIVN